MMIVMIYLPAIIYRFSLKSSFIIWLPLIFIIGQNTSHKKEIIILNETLTILRNSMLAKIQFFYSFIAIFILTIIPMHVEGFKNNFLGKTLSNYFFAFQMDAWHWSRFLASVLTIFLFLYSDKILLKKNTLSSRQVSFSIRLIRLVKMIRTPLSLFTIFCGLYLLISPIDWEQQIQNMKILPL